MPRTPPRNSTRTSTRTSREQPVACERRRRRRPRPAFGGGPTSKTLSYDAAGNLIDDGQDYEYVYDAWHRLVRIEVRSSADIVSEHRYPPYGWGNGFRAGERYDSNEDGRVNSSDKWYWFGYDERWRIVGTFRDADSSPIRLMKNSLRGEGDPEGPDARSCGAAVFEEYGEPRRRRRGLLGVVRSPNGVLHQPDNVAGSCYTKTQVSAWPRCFQGAPAGESMFAVVMRPKGSEVRILLTPSAGSSSQATGRFDILESVRLGEARSNGDDLELWWYRGVRQLQAPGGDFPSLRVPVVSGGQPWH